MVYLRTYITAWLYTIYTQLASVAGPYNTTGGLVTHFNFTEHIFSWKSDSCIGSHEISRLLWEVLITMATKFRHERYPEPPKSIPQQPLV